jgi:hypothetical protein
MFAVRSLPELQSLFPSPLFADNPLTYKYELVLEMIYNLLTFSLRQVEHIKLYEMFASNVRLTALREFQLT